MLLPGSIANCLVAQFVHWASLFSLTSLCSDLNPGNKARYRQHAMSVWLRLVPKLHLSGAEHTFPGHNIFHENPGPSDSWDQDRILQLQRVQRLQLNRAFESQQLTTGISVSVGPDT